MVSEKLFCTRSVSHHLPVIKIHNQPKVKLCEEVNKSVLSHVTFYLEDDDHKPVDYTDGTVSFTCQLIKI